LPFSQKAAWQILSAIFREHHVCGHFFHEGQQKTCNMAYAPNSSFWEQMGHSHPVYRHGLIKRTSINVDSMSRKKNYETKYDVNLRSLCFDIEYFMCFIYITVLYIYIIYITVLYIFCILIHGEK